MSALKHGLAIGAAFLASVGGAQAQQVVKVGYNPTTAAVNSFVDRKTALPAGIYVDLVTAIAKDAGFQVEFHPQIAADAVPMLNAKIIDVAIGGTVGSSSVGIIQAKPFGTLCCGDGLFVLKTDNKEYKSLDELKGLAVASHPGFIATVQKVVPDVKQLASSDGLKAVASGQVKAAVEPNDLAADILQAGAAPEVQMVMSYKGSVRNDVMGFQARAADADLVAKIDKSIAKFMADGTMKTIFSNYGRDWQPPK